jgi:hypothetical protein
MMRRIRKPVKPIKLIKLIIILMISAILLPFLIGGIGVLLRGTENTKFSNENETIARMSQTEKQEFQNAKTEEELLKYKLKEQEEKAKKDKIEALQNPEIIEKELEKVGKLICYEGKIYYNDKVIHKKLLSSRKLSLKLLYKFGIAIDLNNVIIDEFIDDTVVLRIPDDSLVLEYIQMIPEESYVNGEKSLLAKYFKPEEVKVLLDEAQNTTIDRVNNTDAIFEKAEESLRENLQKLVLRLGYNKVIFSN